MELVRISISVIGSRRGRSVFPEFEAEEVRRDVPRMNKN